MVQKFGRWSVDELRAAADLAKEKGVGIRLQADGSISIGVVPPPCSSDGQATIASLKRPELPNVFTPATLAERWLCSEHHVRNLIERGHLGHFSLGGKLLRISRTDVECIENAVALGTSDINDPKVDLRATKTVGKRQRARRLDLPYRR